MAKMPKKKKTVINEVTNDVTNENISVSLLDSKHSEGEENGDESTNNDNNSENTVPNNQSTEEDVSQIDTDQEKNLQLNKDMPDDTEDTPSKSDGMNWNSLWLIGGVVGVCMILVWYSFYTKPHHNIPIMLLVKLVEQGNPHSVLNPLPSLSEPQNAENGQEKVTEEKTTSPESAESSESAELCPPVPFIIVEEGTEKKLQKIKYSNLDHISIAPNDVTGTVIREVIFRADGKKLTKPQEVPFTSGRRGLNFDNNELFNQLRSNGFENVSAKGPPGFWESYGFAVCITLLLVAVVVFLFYQLGNGVMAFGQNRNIQVFPDDIDVSFSDVAGVNEAVEELREIVDFLKYPEKFQQLGGRIPKGVLLVGPPGTGKTLLAKAVAGEASVPFFSLSGSDFVEIYVGIGAARVRDLFQQAEKNSPSIIFIDELDALGKTRSVASIAGQDEREQTLNALLVEMDGFDTNSGTIVIAATNRPEILDSALLRSGRFDRQVLVDRPDIAGRDDILRIHTKQIKMGEDIDLRQIASITSGFVGADLATLVNEAALLAARAEKEVVTMAEFNEAVERITTGLEKKQRIMTEDEKKRIAWHECGHAIIATLLPNSDPVHKVSIIPRGFAALGYTMQRPEDERFLMTKRELESNIQILLAGTIAEELVFEDISTGSQNDLERATHIAQKMVTSFGMSRLGRVTYHESHSTWLDEESSAARFCSEKTAWKIDQEIQSIIDHLFQQTKAILAQHRPLLDRLANRLLEIEVIDGDELRTIIKESE